MGLTLNVAKKINGVFNWLASPPKNHWTLRELLPIITDNQISPEKPQPKNRVARVIERAAMVTGLTLGTVFSIKERDPTIFPVAMGGIYMAGWLAGGVATMMLYRALDMSESFENWAIKREHKNEIKADLRAGAKREQQEQKKAKSLRIQPLQQGPK